MHRLSTFSRVKVLTDAGGQREITKNEMENSQLISIDPPRSYQIAVSMNGIRLS